MRRFVLAVFMLVLSTPSLSASHATQTQPTVWNIVALGDSGTTGVGDPTRLGWVGRYARLLRQKLGLKVVVTNLSESGKSSSALLAEMRSDPTTRAAVKKAEIVLFGSAAGASLNSGDAKMEAGTCKLEACYAAELQSWGRDFDRIVAVSAALRGSKKTVLRGMTEPNGLTGAENEIPPFLKPIATRIAVYQAKKIRKVMCNAMARHRGRCIDVLRTFNGPDGTRNAYKSGLMGICCYPSGKGQQLMAELLFKTGLAPLR